MNEIFKSPTGIFLFVFENYVYLTSLSFEICECTWWQLINLTGSLMNLVCLKSALGGTWRNWWFWRVLSSKRATTLDKTYYLWNFYIFIRKKTFQKLFCWAKTVIKKSWSTIYLQRKLNECQSSRQPIKIRRLHQKTSKQMPWAGFSVGKSIPKGFNFRNQ